MKQWRKAISLLVLIASVSSVWAQVETRGDIDLWNSGSRLRIYADRISNLGETATDKLRFRVWATDHRWGQLGDRHVLGIIPIGVLEPGVSWRGFYRSTRISFPDSGWWWVTVTLEERTYDESGNKVWITHEVIEFDEHYFTGIWGPFSHFD